MFDILSELFNRTSVVIKVQNNLFSSQFQVIWPASFPGAALS